MRRLPKASGVRATAPNASTSQRESPIIIPKDRHAHDTPLRAELSAGVRARLMQISIVLLEKTFPLVARYPARRVWTAGLDWDAMATAENVMHAAAAARCVRATPG
jgi:hypothetical protein